MGLPESCRQFACFIGLGVATLAGCLDAARAATAGCFATAAACVVPGTLTLTSQVSNTFSPSGEDILADAVLSGEITTLTGTQISPFSLTGTVEQEVIGRLSPTATGSWTVDLTGLTFTGSALGDTLSVSLDGSQTSSGTTSIVPSGGNFVVNSFFDVFVDLGLNSAPPQSANGGSVVFNAVPEPTSLLILTPVGLTLLAVRRRGRGLARNGSGRYGCAAPMVRTSWRLRMASLVTSTKFSTIVCATSMRSNGSAWCQGRAPAAIACRGMIGSISNPMRRATSSN
jgi:hypothetical protein